MEDDNKKNLCYFEASSMKELFDSMQEWQNLNKKRLLSLNVEKDADRFCCIALTNPTEVVILGPSPSTFGKSNVVSVSNDGALRTC